MSVKRQDDWGRVIFGLICAAVGFWFGYWVWPDTVANKPITNLTWHEWHMIVFSVFSGLFGLWGLGRATEK